MCIERRIPIESAVKMEWKLAFGWLYIYNSKTSAHRPIHGQMFWCWNLPFDASQHMSDVHQMIIDNIGKVIRWITIRFQNHEIAFRLQIECFFAINQVVDCFSCVCELKPEWKRRGKEGNSEGILVIKCYLIRKYPLTAQLSHHFVLIFRQLVRATNAYIDYHILEIHLLLLHHGVAIPAVVPYRSSNKRVRFQSKCSHISGIDLNVDSARMVQNRRHAAHSRRVLCQPIQDFRRADPVHLQRLDFDRCLQFVPEISHDWLWQRDNCTVPFVIHPGVKILNDTK